MKKKKSIVFIVILMFIIVINLFNYKNEDSKRTASDSLVIKAENILNELSDEDTVADFKEIYNILNNLPTKKSGFLKELKKATDIAEMYNFSLEGAEWYFKPYSSVTEEAIADYIDRRVYHDMRVSLDSMIRPLLFQNYGYDINHIRGVSKKELSYIIDHSGYYLNETKDAGDYIKDIWCEMDEINEDYEVCYYENDLVYSVKIPIMKSFSFLKTEEEQLAFFSKSSEEQQKAVKKEMDVLLKNFAGFDKQKSVLSVIYSDKEVEFLENYIASLTADFIWNNNFMDDDVTSTVCLRYKDTAILIKFGYSTVDLTITGYNFVNEYTSRYNTLLCCYAGLNENDYIDYINNNTASNLEDILKSAIDLNAIA